MSRKESVKSYLDYFKRITTLDPRQNFFRSVPQAKGLVGVRELDWVICDDHPSHSLRSGGAVGTGVCFTHPFAETAISQGMKGTP